MSLLNPHFFKSLNYGQNFQLFIRLGFEFFNFLHLYLVFVNPKSSYALTIFFALFLWWFFELSFGLWTGVDGVAFHAHKACIESIEGPGVYNSLNLKLVCSYNPKKIKSGKITNTDLVSLFAQLGLLHLLVASGTHLLILKKGCQILLRPLTFSHWPVFLFLFLFVLGSNFNTPVTRSFVQVLITHYNFKKSLALTPTYLSFCSSCLFLLFFPSALLSLSFWLSLSASLFIAVFGKNILQLSFVFYIGLMPFIINFIIPSTTSILINLIITPLLGPFLIINSFLYSILNYYRPLGDAVFQILVDVLSGFVLNSPNIKSEYFRVSSHIKFFYGLAILLLSLYLQHLKSKQLQHMIKSS